MHGDDGNGSGSSAGRSLLKDRAYDAIKRGILGEDFPPGTFLAERQLAERLGMSKTPVKAALERLELEGFITVSPQQGIVVRDLTVHEIADQYEIRAALETYTLRATAGHLTTAQVAQVRANLKAQQGLCGSSRVAEGVALDTEFHMLFAEFLGNQEILRVMRQLREKMQRVVTKVLQLNPGRLDSNHDEHLAIAEAVIGGDGARAAGLLEAHLARGKQMILSPRRS
jgi:DNA-binding GntR family transcriptional regulator